MLEHNLLARLKLKQSIGYKYRFTHYIEKNTFKPQFYIIWVQVIAKVSAK